MKVGVSPAEPGPQTVPAAPQLRRSRRAGFLANYRVFPETPTGQRLGRCLPFAVLPLGHWSRGRVQPRPLPTPTRPGHGGEAQRSGTPTSTRWGRRQISGTGAKGKGGGRSSGRLCPMCGSQLLASRAEPGAPSCPPHPIHQSHPASQAAKRNCPLSIVATINSLETTRWGGGEWGDVETSSLSAWESLSTLALKLSPIQPGFSEQPDLARRQPLLETPTKVCCPTFLESLHQRNEVLPFTG